MKRLSFFFPWIWFFLTISLWADLVPEVPSAVLLDQLTGRILFQKNPNVPLAPASLTKLMTLHLAWQAMADQRIEPSTLVPVTSQTTGAAVPPGSSLMFLEPGQRVTVRELMLGLAVDSGNDAGLTLAGFLAGSQEAFVAAMNAEATRLGLPLTRFFDAYGYDARNRTTAAEFAQFCRHYLLVHPQAVEVLHNVREMAYPLAENVSPSDRRPVKTIVQQNRNTLLEAYPGADGLKTGYIDESGYNLAATAQRDGRRLVAVLLGAQGRTSEEGGRLRTAAAIRLLDFGFQHYPLRPLPLPELPSVRVWYSEPGNLTPAPAGPTVYPLTNGEGSGIEARVEGLREVLGPVPLGTSLGKLVWSKAGQVFYEVPLVATKVATEAPWWTNLWDSIVLFFRGWTGTPAPVKVGSHT